MSVKICNLRVEEKWVGPGMSGLFAEFQVERWDDTYKGDFYISVMDIIGPIYAVSSNSVFELYENEVEDLEELEHYETLSDAAKSEFFNYFVYLEKMINDLNSNFERTESVKITDRERTNVIEITDEEEYYIAAIDTFKSNGKQLKATVCYGTISNYAGISAEVVDISLVDEEDRVIEGYDDFDAAIKSDYIALYCDLNNYLKDCIIEYFNNNEELEVEPEHFLALFEPTY